MRVLVTGGAGFIGSHLVDRLLDRGDDVVVLDNFRTGRRVNLAHRDGDTRLTVIDHDIADPLPTSIAAEQFQAVLHLASPASPVGYARYPIETMLANSYGTRNALEVAERSGAVFVFTSTSEVYGDPLIHPQPESYWGNVNPIGPRACYDESKRFGEALTIEYARKRGVDARIARIFNTYGPRSDPRDGRVVPNFCMQALRNEPITIYGNGEQTRSFCYVDDLVEGLIRLTDTPDLGGEVINLGNPDEITVRGFAEAVIRVSQSRSTLVFKPLPIDDPTRRQPDIEKARRLLGWQPMVKLDEGLRRAIASFRHDPAADPSVPVASSSS